MQNFLSGVATALITPFTEDDKIHLDCFAELIEFQLQNDIDGLVILGTTGEPSTIDAREKASLIEFAHRQIAGRCKLIVGTGGNSTLQVIKESIVAERLGADGLLIVTPYYNKCTQGGLIAHYTAIAKAVDIPIICYNVPTRTGVNILPETIQELSAVENIVGIKESCRNMQQICETARRIRGRCELYSGDDCMNIPMLALGSSGIISVVSNVLPRETKELYRLMQTADLQKANALQDKMLPIIDTLFLEVNPIPTKAAMQFMGFDVGKPRLPLTAMEEIHIQKLQQALRNFGVIS